MAMRPGADNLERPLEERERGRLVALPALRRLFPLPGIDSAHKNSDCCVSRTSRFVTLSEGEFVSVSADVRCTCRVLQEGSVVCWGGKSLVMPARRLGGRTFPAKP